MDYLKTVAPTQILSERGANLVVINLGSANVRVGLAMDEKPFNVPNCIARYITQSGKPTVVDQVLSNFCFDLLCFLLNEL
jgi:actin-related protein 8